jgi:hypothetical protein
MMSPWTRLKLGQGRPTTLVTLCLGFWSAALVTIRKAVATMRKAVAA